MPMRNLALDEVLEETMDDAAAYLGRRFLAEIRAEKWNWPRDPSPRDIVDTGNLAKSQRIVRASSTDRRYLAILFIYSAPYAAAVHDGAIFKRTNVDGNPVTISARPWTRPVLYDRRTIQSYVQRRAALAMGRRRDR